MYPALAVLKALQDDEERLRKSIEPKNLAQPDIDEMEVVWVGGEGGIEVELLRGEKVDFRAIPAAGVHGVGLNALPGNLWKILKGFFAARKIIKQFSPKVMFFTGGYLAVPVAIAGRTFLSKMQRPRILLYVPDIEPGLALKTLSNLSDEIALTVEDSMKYFDFRSNLHVTGYPVRPNLRAYSREQAQQEFNLLPHLPTLLVFGGSKGARSINRALAAILPQLLIDIQVIHISGHLDWEEMESLKEQLPDPIQSRYHVYAYLYQEMDAALSAADLVVSRSGASVLGEFPLFGLPAILVPYPHAWRYQEVNARYLEENGAAVVLQDDELNNKLLATIQDLIMDLDRRKRMGQTMTKLANPHAAENIAELIYERTSLPAPGRI